ncbi:Outer membrane cobalamin receptor protein, SusC/RagA family [Bacteroidales bacterium Barb4]|nr:Outer membrane cobalamin receptor protein, SusC/RagA family [Bacteroidales bacterium Barb4]
MMNYYPIKNTVALRGCYSPRLKMFMMCFLLISTSFGSAHVSGQTETVKGIVLDAGDKSPIIGAAILVKGTSIGTTTDIDGNFTIANVPSSAKVLQVSYIGMKEQEVDVAPVLNIILQPDLLQIDEVIVVAYGTSKKSSFTGAASLVKAEKLGERPVTNVTNALVGAVAGVQVSTANGQPGSEPSIYIRGIGSYGASNSPLIILNGMPYENTISSINPNDIESLTVLKDASSSALYGSRAANGVVMITTKTGTKEKVSVNVKFNQGVTAKQTSDYRKAGLNDYVSLYWENLRNRYVSDGKSAAEAGQLAAAGLFTDLPNPFNVPNNQVVDNNGQVNPNAKHLWADDVDWMNAIQQLGNRTDAAVSVSGASDKTDYYASAGFTNEEGYVIGSKFKRYTINGNVNSQVKNWLKIGFNTSANLSATDGNQNEAIGNNTNPFRFVRYIGPVHPIHLHNLETGEYLRDESGNLIYDFGTGYSINGVTIPIRNYVSGNNPAIELQNNYDGNKRNTINAKVYTEIKLPEGFKLSLNGSVGANSYLASAADIVYPDKGISGSMTKTNTFTTTWTFNELLSYTKDIDKHHIDVLAGHESYDYEYNYLSSSMKDQKFDGNFEFGNYSNLNTTPDSYTNKYATEGFLSRFNYDYDSQYFLSGSFRRDGSSRFYTDSRWGNFWSVGGGWRIDKEEFMAGIDFIDILKLRASYGEVGNDNVGSYYPWRGTYKVAQNAGEAGYIQNILENKTLKWEVSHNSDAALEFSLLNGKYSGSVEYFNRLSGNLLFAVPLSPSTGVNSQDMNAGTMYNRGIEVELSAKLLQKKDFSWSASLNATYLKNRITALPVDPFISDVHKIEEGHSRYEYWLRQWKGVDPATGSSLYVPLEEILGSSTSLVTVNGETYTTSATEALYDYSGTATPKVSGGLSTNFTYGHFNLGLVFYYQLGGKMYDIAYSYLMSPGVSTIASLYPSALHADMLNRWQKPGDITSVPRISTVESADLTATTSTRWLISSDMLELSSINLGYDFPKQWIHTLDISGLRLYGSADNVFQITKRQGTYPRRNIFSGYSDNGDVYLPSRVFTIGLNITF